MGEAKPWSSSRLGEHAGDWDDQVPAFTHASGLARRSTRVRKVHCFADVSADPDDLRILLDSLGMPRPSVLASRPLDVATRFAFTYPHELLRLRA